MDAVEGAEAAQLSEKVRQLLGQKGAPSLPAAATDGLRPPAVLNGAPADGGAGRRVHGVARSHHK